MSLDDWNDGWLEGQRDMLAKCIEAVEAESLYDNTGDPVDVGYMQAITDVLATLRALQEKP